MENTYQENLPFNQERSVAFEQKLPNPVKKEKPILLQVFKTVFLGFFVGIVKGVYHFFKQYFVLIWDCAKFLWKPNADEHTAANEKTIKNSKETFEFILVITAITLFFIKQGWIESTDELKEVYGNDIAQYMMEFVFFLFYALIYFVVLVILVLTGRLLRILFKSIETRDVTDKVFINLNNIFFIGTVIYSFIRKFDPSNATDIQNVDDEWLMLWLEGYAIPLAVIVFLFFIRLVMINKLTIGRALTYCIVAPVVTVVILAFCGFVVTALFAGI